MANPRLPSELPQSVLFLDTDIFVKQRNGITFVENTTFGAMKSKIKAESQTEILAIGDTRYAPASATIIENGDNISLLTNDSGYVVTASNISQFINNSGYIQSGALISLLTNDVGYVVPSSNVSQFTNDAGYITTAIQAGNNVSLLANNVNYTVSGSNISQFINDSGYVVPAANISIFTNNSNYVASGANISVFTNNSNYLVPTDSIGLLTNDGTYLQDNAFISRLNNNLAFVSVGADISAFNNDLLYLIDDVANLDNLNDVVIVTPIENDVLQFIGGKWVNSDLSVSGPVISFNGRSGIVLSVIGDYSAFYEPLGESLVQIGVHNAESDPHPQYLTPDDLPTIVVSWYTDNTSAVDGAFLSFTQTEPATAEGSVVVTADAGVGVPKLLGQFLRDDAFTSAFTIFETNLSLNFDISSTGTNVELFVEIYKLAGITETLLLTTSIIPILTPRQVYNINSNFTGGVSFAVGDRLIHRVFVTKNAGGSDPVVTLFTEGANLSRSITQQPIASIPAPHAVSHEVGGSDLIQHDNLTGAFGQLSHSAIDSALALKLENITAEPIDDLSDVSAAAPSENDILQLKSGVWTAGAVPSPNETFQDAGTQTFTRSVQITLINRFSSGAVVYTLDESTYQIGDVVRISRLSVLAGNITVITDEGTMLLPDGSDGGNTQTMNTGSFAANFNKVDLVNWRVEVIHTGG